MGAAPDGLVDDAARARLQHFAELLLDINRHLNLTGARDADALWRAHIADSLALFPLIHEDHRLLDLGSGGGLPGLVLACTRPNLHVTLLDARRKKVAALEQLIAALALPNAAAVWGRAEKLAEDAALRGVFDVVTARAVAALPVLIEWSAPFVRPGGVCWFFKSTAALEHEVAAAATLAARRRMAALPVHEYLLKGDAIPRVLLGYRKLASS
ncbi:Ribosomal RNA small subunit methyltransferase G [Phycisphaerae bacterium RAS1]|nr:Ribosomal RNA small subunit methyltransferase G [Phycisphaerae bacterium RAS1]